MKGRPRAPLFESLQILAIDIYFLVGKNRFFGLII
jgi:hypothetical protein